jgi:EAL domain-containing protein (putative c-di-GMP-specific phosphodiesterase class I)
VLSVSASNRHYHFCDVVCSLFQAHNRLGADLDSEKFEVLETQSFANEVTTAMKKLKEKDVRIIIGNFNEFWARRVFCEAHRYCRDFGRVCCPVLVLLLL